MFRSSNHLGVSNELIETPETINLMYNLKLIEL